MYFTGTVNSNADMLTAINNACAAAGWTLTSGVLTSGNVAIKLSTTTGRMLAQIGTGRSGANVVNPATPQMGLSFSTGAGTAGAIVYPATYHIYAYADEVYVALNYRADFYQWMGFGQLKDVPAGEGQFLSASITDAYTYSANENILGIFYSATYGGFPGNTYQTNEQSTAASVAYQAFRPILVAGSNIVVRSSLTGPVSWISSKNGNTVALINQVYGNTVINNKLIEISPGATFYTAALCPMSFAILNPGGVTGIKLFGRLDNIRMMRNDFVVAGDTVTFGSESWQAFPVIRRNPNGTVNEKISYAMKV